MSRGNGGTGDLVMASVAEFPFFLLGPAALGYTRATLVAIAAYQSTQVPATSLNPTAAISVANLRVMACLRAHDH